MEENDERYLSTEEVAEHFAVSTMTIYRLANANRIPYLRVGRSFRFRLSEVEEAIRTESAEAS